MLNKSDRAKLAKKTINKFIPHLIEVDARVREGVQQSELIHYSPTDAKASQAIASPEAESAPSESSHETEAGNPSKRRKLEALQKLDSFQSTPKPSTSSSAVQPRIRIIKSDTFDAAEATLRAHPKASVAVLNMASALQPGGGVLRGALAQKEALCVRSTLHPSLDPSFYRIPLLAAIYSPDVLVFRGSDLVDLPKFDWFHTAVIICAALRQPDVEKGKDGKMIYSDKKEREVMMDKIRLIFQIAKDKGITHLILGALGCGAYRNPPEEVAVMFRKVLLEGRRHEGVTGIEEVTFAIFNEGENLTSFKEMFEDIMVD
ncbi:uncharacterized protein RAG0_12479 [Rhynchosporium agropyri]|uniref:Microbial-type PARG catalytic domain-containing protein n=1 Tax=Rhynchosporium agropyri TaxID=914238 RepID=A0A1E1L8J4_9HELO|nr:uncharacterized protein RAG0_12479 [Rhynchosporium agropyri]